MNKYFFLALFFLYSCASVEYSDKKYSLYDSRYPDYTYSESAHFIVNSRSSSYAKEISDMAEKYYYSLMMDTNLFSFVQVAPYRIVVHEDKESFLKKTKAPKWSGGFISSNTIETYISTQTPCVIAHEITHLILNEYLGDYAEIYPWISEGLAVYQERKACFESDLKYEKILKSKVYVSPYPFSVLNNLKPKNNDKIADVEKFYAQSSDIIKFLIKKEGSFKFYIFIDGLKRGLNLDFAIKNAYPAVFNDAYQLEKKWLNEIGK